MLTTQPTGRKHVTVRVKRCYEGGSERASLVVIVNGKELACAGGFGGEPEDQIESRQYSWVKAVIAGVAKELGAEVEVHISQVATVEELEW